MNKELIPSNEKRKMIEKIMGSDNIILATMNPEGKVSLFTYCSLELIEKILPALKSGAEKILERKES